MGKTDITANNFARVLLAIARREECHYGACDPSPLPEIDTGNCGEAPLIGWKASAFPVVHDQPDIDAVLECGEVHGVGEVVADVQW